MIFRNSFLIERFEARVIRVPFSGCWIWDGPPKGPKLRDQYGFFRMNGPQYRSHRASWLLYMGAIPDGLHVLHRCDNPACVNPNHLFLGSNLDNVADRVRKGRTGFVIRKGEAHPMARLSAPQVSEIRRRYAAGEKGSILAAEFGMSRPAISNIITGKRWKAQ